GDAEAHRVLHRAVEPDDRRRDPELRQVGLDQTRVRGGDPPPGQAALVGHGAGAGGEPELGRAEVQVEQLLGRPARVQQQVPPGDAQLQVPRADVGGDVARTQVEELDLVVDVAAHQLAAVGALPVSGL